MRALCGAIITAGALIGLGLTSLAIGTRYQNFIKRNETSGQIESFENQYIKFRDLDTGLSIPLVVLLLATMAGFAIAFIGLAYHHARRHREWLREGGHTTTSTHAPV